MISVVIIGCGDIGRRVAALWRERGTPVIALARRPATAEALAALGITPIVGDLDAPESLMQLPTADALVYYFAPPPPRGSIDPRMGAFLATLSQGRAPRRIVYISTSGVYGDRRGEWVDETVAPNPQTDRARRRLDAENALRAWGREQGVEVVVLRVGGIYGPGRLPRERLAEGRPVLRETESGYTNRIHADDLAAACLAAAERGRAGAVYNVSDGQPGTMTGYFNAVADRLGLPRPPEISMAEARERLSPVMLSYLTESRRMDNRRMCEELGVRLRYPDLESGLTQAVADERNRL